ncbi:MAG: YbaK/EbsC family protein [Betaproteobacteria bacterium]|nr:YbaK/EbsC family protein [Betaproteobacteria bacterium]
MSIAHTVQNYMVQRGIAYEIVNHPHTLSSMETAAAAHVSGDRVAKAVILEDDDGYVLAVVPSTHHVRINALSAQLQRKLRLATEMELARLFGDCEPGAIPPVGTAYGLPTVIEEDLAQQPEVYFEAGDHEGLIRVRRDDFMRLMTGARQAHFSRHL